MSRKKSDSRHRDWRSVAAFSSMLSLALVLLAACGGSDAGGGPDADGGADATVFEGARLIVGDGSAPIEDAVFIVENDRFTQVG